MMLGERRRQDLVSWQDELSASFVRLDVAAIGVADHLDTRLLGTKKGATHSALVDVRGEPHIVRRTRRAAAHDDGGLLVSVQMAGSCIVRQDGREALLTAGDIAWYDAGRPYDLVFTEGSHQQAVLKLPYDGFAHASSLLDHTAFRVSGDQGVGYVIGNLLRAIPHSIQDVEAVDADRIAQVALDLLLLGAPSRSSKANPLDLLESSREFIRAHADDPDLTPGRVAAAVHLSLGHLHRVFRGSDSTISEYLRTVRLGRAATDLRDPHLAHWTIADIAQRRGFKDAAHFSRAFAARYGVSPMMWRRSTEH
jgi:AraC-like DNA-binding protein